MSSQLESLVTDSVARGTATELVYRLEDVLPAENAHRATVPDETCDLLLQ